MSAEYAVTLEPSGHVLRVLAGERVLDAARRLGFEVPHSCRNGNCEICAALLLEGSMRYKGQTISSGEVMTCLCEPLSDCRLHWDKILAPGELLVHSLSCQVLALSALGAGVTRVQLRAPAGKKLRYHAGQYLLLEKPDGEQAAFSIASAPHHGRELELHIQVRDSASQHLLEHLYSNTLVNVQLPFGDCHLAELPAAPLVLIAAGTGMAQMHSLIEHCRAQGFAHPVHVYWGARSPQDFYQLDAWRDWQGVPNLTLHQVVSEAQPDDHWQGRQGLLFEAVREDFPDLSVPQVYASGSPNMVYATLDGLVAAGLSPSQMRADVFAYAPRD
ncbi:CDP-6-deoxy-delta-3,4-glucoseen reductase [Atopomonas sediminilitoris]|uniref:CDP-6-deoxy-delta-3,4-glucoseen reductase n=1 Tax=Atopomonas sediminilitoris TaxID=2919919 RepID=UPI001F4D9557|nr:CDP-6-deoxy-delta-3,4-glucoseen reductase [Atopomonas sediminilitoris]